MDRIIKIAIYIAILFFASIWISSVVKSCNAPADDISHVENIDEELDEFEEEFFEDNLGDGESTYESEMGGGSTEADDDYEEEFAADYTEIDEAIEERITYTKPAKTYNKSTASAGGKYMILTGSYLIKGNASNMVNKLSKLGYTNAELVVFNMSQYHSVCAARLYDYNEALQMSNELKSRGIENYVHTRQ